MIAGQFEVIFILILFDKIFDKQIILTAIMFLNYRPVYVI